MFEPRRLLDEKKIRLVFEVSLWLKGVFALSEVIAGVATYFISQQFLLAIVLWVTKEEFAEDPHDIIANSLLHAVQNFSVSTQKFVALYLLGHGVIKLCLFSPTIGAAIAAGYWFLWSVVRRAAPLTRSTYGRLIVTAMLL
jgi:uncharacterized membrane protein